VDLSQKRWTLDKKEDYELIKRIFNKLYRSNPRFGMQAIIDFVNKNPKLEKINRHLKTNAGYLKSLKKDRALKPRDWE
jgi:spore coat polysaccharide biosynthesis protein SpsF (cytidylyltransferase family)